MSILEDLPEEETWSISRTSRDGSSAPEVGRQPPPAPSSGADAPLLPWDVDEPEPRRRWVLPAAAVVPWLVVAGMLWLRAGVATDGDDSPQQTSSPQLVASDVSSGESAEPAVDEVAGSRGTEAAVAAVAAADDVDERTEHVIRYAEYSRSSAGSGTNLAVSVALIAARSFLSTQPAGGLVEGMASASHASERYVEHVWAESIDHPAGTLAVVTVSALVLQIEDGRYSSPSQVRVAVPVDLSEDAPVLAGTPWLLPGLTTAVRPISDLEEITDADLHLSAVDAITAAGYRDVEVSALLRGAQWALVADFSGIAPGESQPASHQVWLRVEVDHLIVAGWSAGNSQ